MAETKQTISAREKWQQEVASTLQSDAITSGMFVSLTFFAKIDALCSIAFKFILD